MVLGWMKTVERVQKAAVAILLGESYHYNKHALYSLDVKPLKPSVILCPQTSKHPKFEHWFIPNGTGIGTTPRGNTKYRPILTVLTGTKNPPPILTDLLINSFKQSEDIA